jgi:hypothetical protein
MMLHWQVQSKILNDGMPACASNQSSIVVEQELPVNETVDQIQQHEQLHLIC